MFLNAEHTKENKSRAFSATRSQERDIGTSSLYLIDNRLESINQLKARENIGPNALESGNSSQTIQRVVHLKGENYEEDDNTPKYNIPIGNHWVFFDVARWTYDEAYKRKMQALYKPLRAPAYRPGVTPIDIPLDRVNNDLTLKDDGAIDGGIGDDALPREEQGRIQIISKTNQTGDIPHIAAAMANNPLIDVVIVYTEDKLNVAQSMESTYRNAIRNEIVPPGVTRIKLLRETDDPTHSWYGALIPNHAEDGPVGPPRWRSKEPEHEQYYSYPSTNARGGRSEYDMMYVGGATSEVARQYDNLGPNVFIEKNKSTLTDREMRNRDIIDFFKKYYNFNLGFDSGQPRLLLIWSRYSGSVPGGYNPAGDSSIRGNQQLISEVAAKTSRIPITIGHDSPDAPTPTGTIHLGEFWNLDVPNNPFRGKGRAGQTAFYVLLNKTHDVVQLGQKTGGIDNAALVGIRTIYIEDYHSPQYGRMQKWAKQMDHYASAIIKEPPTAIGKAIRIEQGKEYESEGAVAGGTHKGGNDEVMLAAEATSGQYEEGYSRDDLGTIVGEVKRMDEVLGSGLGKGKASTHTAFGSAPAPALSRDLGNEEYSRFIATLRSLGPELIGQTDHSPAMYQGYELSPQQIQDINGRTLLQTPPDGDCSINAVLGSLHSDRHPREVRYEISAWALGRGLVGEADALKMKEPGEFSGNISAVLLQGLSNVESVNITIIRPAGPPWEIKPDEAARNGNVTLVFVFGSSGQGHYYGTTT